MRCFFIYILTILVVPNLLTAQNSLQQNSKYINFDMNRTPFVSGGFFLRNNLALEAGVGLAFNGENNSNGLGIRLGLDKFSNGDQLVPFFGGYVRFDINPNSLGDTYWKGSRLILGSHWGLNYFVIKNFGLAGTIGAELHLNSPKDGDSSTNFSSLTSGIKLRFFF
jgi:hypothetical protein